MARHRRRTWSPGPAMAMAVMMLLLGSGVVSSAEDDTRVPASTPAVPAGRKAETIAVIPIHGAIDGLTVRSLTRRLALAKERGADAVVLELDTPGGDLQATFAILELVRTQSPPNTIAWIRPKAFSAGTIIALAAREIVTTPTGVFGDAAPIQADPIRGLRELPAAERAKLEAPLLSELVFDARRQGWDEKLVQAFVAVDVELWLIRNRESGDLLFVDASEYERVFGEPPDSTAIDRLPAPSTRLVPGFESSILGSPEAGRRDVAEEASSTLLDDREAAIEMWQEARSRRPTLDRADAPDWENLGQVISSDQLLVLRADEAIAFGLSSRSDIADEADLKSFMGAGSVIRLEESWSEGMVRFLTLWPVRAVLIAVMLVGFFIEISAPGYGAFGLAAISALAMLLGAPLLAGLSDWWTVVVVVVGIALVVAELFLLPGFGVAGVLGGLLLFAGLIGTFVSGDPFAPEMRADLFKGIAATLTGGLAAGAVSWLFWRTLPNNPLAARIILSDEIASRSETSGTTLVDTSVVPLGTVGVASTPLRTAGRVEIDGRLVDAQSEDGFIERGMRVRVVASDRFGVRVELDRT